MKQMKAFSMCTVLNVHLIDEQDTYPILNIQKSSVVAFLSRTLQISESN